MTTVKLIKPNGDMFYKREWEAHHDVNVEEMFHICKMITETDYNLDVNGKDYGNGGKAHYKLGEISAEIFNSKKI